MKKLMCKIFHRNYSYGPVDGWPSSLYKECMTCGHTVASGTRSWDAWNKR